MALPYPDSGDPIEGSGTNGKGDSNIQQSPGGDLDDGTTPVSLEFGTWLFINDYYNGSPYTPININGQLVSNYASAISPPLNATISTSPGNSHVGCVVPDSSITYDYSGGYFECYASSGPDTHCLITVDATLNAPDQNPFSPAPHDIAYLGVDSPVDVTVVFNTLLRQGTWQINCGIMTGGENPSGRANFAPTGNVMVGNQIVNQFTPSGIALGVQVVGGVANDQKNVNVVVPAGGAYLSFKMIGYQTGSGPRVYDPNAPTANEGVPFTGGAECDVFVGATFLHL